MKKSSIVTHYFLTGLKKSEHFEVNSVKEGMERWWNEKGQLIFECEYISNQVHGKVQVWNDFGKLIFLYYKKHGINHGKYTSWWDNGNVKEKGFFIEGKRQKGYQWYRKNGSLWSEC